MKKLFALMLVCLLVCSLSGVSALADSEEPLRIVCTTFPQYDWVRQVLGERADQVELTLLLDNGMDLHSYQPTAVDIIRISESDLFIYGGGESDRWVDDVLSAARNPQLVAISLLDSVEAREEELVEGMQEDDHDHEDEEHEETEYDEHVWLSLRNAEDLTRLIADALCGLDADHAETYAANAEAYCRQLEQLDGEYQAAVEAGSRSVLLFADRFPFRYLADDYGLTYYAAFVGCSAETEASFETIAFLTNKVDELELPAVLTIEGGNREMAETVVSSTKTKDQQILVMDSLQSVTAADIEAGAAYLDIMAANLEVLKIALQ